MSKQSELAKHILFIGNLPYSSQKENLLQLAQQFGEVSNCAIVEDERGRSKGFGFVRYQNEQDASNAFQALNDFTIQDRVLRVSYARSDSQYLEVLSVGHQ